MLNTSVAMTVAMSIAEATVAPSL